MKLLSILFLVLFISCEEQGSAEGENNELKGASAAIISDISSDYYGDYSSSCIPDSDLEFGQAKIVELTLDSGAPVVTFKEFGESNCLTLTATREYSLGFTVESHFIESENEINNYLEIEYLESSLTLNHSAYEGYWDCGFTASTHTKYALNSPCQANKDGDLEEYRIEEVSATQYKIIGSSETITLTKL